MRWPAYGKYTEGAVVSSNPLKRKVDKEAPLLARVGIHEFQY